MQRSVVSNGKKPTEYYTLKGRKSKVSEGFGNNMTRKIEAPKLFHGATEGVRTALELFSSAVRHTVPSLMWGRSQEMTGSPIMVVQGFLMHDITTWNLRRHLDDQGHDAFDGDIGINLGVHSHTIEKLEDRLAQIMEKHLGKKVTVIGHSLGGIQSLLLSYRHADKIDRLITMGSPFGAARMQGGTNRIVYGAYEILNPDDSDLVEELSAHMEKGPPDVAVTSLFSAADGVVAPQSAVNPWAEEGHPRTENVEVPGPHCGMIVNTQVWEVLAERLSVSPTNWRPFNRSEAERSVDLAPDLILEKA